MGECLGKGMTSLKRRLDYVLSQLSQMDIEPDEEASGSVAAQLSIVRGAFKESQSYPVCCFRYDDQSRIICDSCGPLTIGEFMKKCRVCQAQIKEALSVLQ